MLRIYFKFWCAVKAGGYFLRRRPSLGHRRRNLLHISLIIPMVWNQYHTRALIEVSHVRWRSIWVGIIAVLRSRRYVSGSATLFAASEIVFRVGVIFVGGTRREENLQHPFLVTFAVVDLLSLRRLKARRVFQVVFGPISRRI